MYGLILDENDESTNKCGKFPDFCYICSENNKHCEFCFLGYSLKIDEEMMTTSCVPSENGPKNCITYANENDCYECNDDYILVPDQDKETGQCYQKPENCEHEYDSINCSDCNIGYGKYIDEKNNLIKCLPCSDENCDTCYSNYSICESCSSGYGKNTETGKCFPCLHDNCDFCNDDYTKCVHCKVGFGHNKTLGENGGCFPCHENCNCIYTDSCSSCIDGFGPLNGDTEICTQCSVANCKVCKDNSSLCNLCKEGYGFAKNEKGEYINECHPCPNNCLSCSHDSKVCSQCNENYGLVLTGEETGQCRECASNCLSCTYNQSECTACKDGYGFLFDANNEFTGQCSECPANCKSCSSNSSKCNVCDDKYGFVLNQEGEQTFNNQMYVKNVTPLLN